MEAVFRVEENRVFASEHTAGPWDPRMQHGGAPSSLIVWAAERIPSPQPMHVARLTVDLMRPVPVAPLTIETEVVREGRKIQLCAIRLLAEGVEVVRATVLKVRSQAVVLPDIVTEMPIDVPGPDGGRAEPQRTPVVFLAVCRFAPSKAVFSCRAPPPSGFARIVRLLREQRPRRR